MSSADNSSLLVSPGERGSFCLCSPVRIRDNKLRLYLFSDLHIGSSYFAEDLFKEHIKRAASENARIIINGDVFDAILLKDPRFGFEKVDRRLTSSSDMIGEALKLAVELLKPYAEYIDVICCGNHELTVLEKNNFDLIKSLVTSLREINKNIQYGGYSGIVQYLFVSKDRKRRIPLNILYHHGWGAGVKTRGLSHFDTLLSYFENIDIFLVGHLHAPVIAQSTRLSYQGNKIISKNCHFIRTPGYFINYKISKHPLKTGYLPNYAICKGLPVTFCGCTVVDIQTNFKTFKIEAKTIN